MNSKSFILLRFLVFLFLFATIGCQKEVSTELPAGTVIGGGGTVGGSAQFALVSSGTNCSDAVVSGAFVAGTELGTDAALTVTVNVTKTGDWTYSTKLVNGFAFAGAGSFTTTGNQAITLQAAGNPTKVGNATFNLNIGGANCTFNVTVAATGGGGGGGVTLSDFYYKATIDGVSYSQDITLTNNYEPGAGMSGSDDVVFGGGITYATPPVPAGSTEFGIDKGVMHGYLAATQAQFKAFFPVGNVPYSSDSWSANGVIVYWTDPSGDAANNRWYTRNGAVDQALSTFKIVSVQDFTDLSGAYFVKVKVEFDCKLYNRSTGAVKAAKGEAVVPFGMF